MRKIAYLLFILLFSCTVYAEKWEYKVVYLPGTATGTKVIPEKSGAYLDVSKTKILNVLGKSGWELIAVTGASGADHAQYMRRRVK